MRHCEHSSTSMCASVLSTSITLTNMCATQSATCVIQSLGQSVKCVVKSCKVLEMNEALRAFICVHMRVYFQHIHHPNKHVCTLFSKVCSKVVGQSVKNAVKSLAVSKVRSVRQSVCRSVCVFEGLSVGESVGVSVCQLLGLSVRMPH